MENYQTGSAASKRARGTSEFILLCPIKSGRIPGERQSYEDRLRSILASIDDRLNWGGEISLARVPTIHFAWFSIITSHHYLHLSKVTPPTPTQSGWDNPDKLRTWLLTVIVFDGTASLYNRDLTALISNDLDRVFGHCEDYPDAASSDLLWTWFQSYQLQSGLFYAAYPGLSAVRIRFLETFKRRFDGFLARVRPRHGSRTPGGLIEKIVKCLLAFLAWHGRDSAVATPPDIEEELDRLVKGANQYHEGFPFDDGSYAGEEENTR